MVDQEKELPARAVEAIGVLRTTRGLIEQSIQELQGEQPAAE